MHKPQDPNTGQSNTKPLTAGITWSTPEEESHSNVMLVTTGNPAEVICNNISAQQPSASSSLATGDIVIPESADDTKPGMVGDQEPGGSKPLLPSIGVFLSKTCTIPLIRCDFDQIKKTVELQGTQPNIMQQSSDKIESKDTGAQAEADKEGTCTETNQTESQTST